MLTMKCLAALATALAVSASNVHELNKDNFNSFLAENELSLLEFYAPWCGHCKRLAPEYEEAADTLKDKNIRLAKIDCVAESDLCKEHNVEGYPTIKVFQRDQFVGSYDGPRKAHGIASYMVKKSLPTVSLPSKETMDDFKKLDKLVIMAVFEASDKASNETYSKVADHFNGKFLFGASNDPEIAEAEGVSLPALIVFKDFDEGKSVLPGAFDFEGTKHFILQSSLPMIGVIDTDTYTDYMAAKLPLAFFFAETQEERSSMGEILKPVFEAHRGKINFVSIDSKTYGAHATNLNLDPKKFPSFVIQDTAENHKFPFDQDKELTYDAVEKFVNDFVEGKLKPSIKSEPIPESQDGPVTILVGKNFNEIVLDDSKDVLVEYFAPWCGHCQALAPKYDRLGKSYKNSSFNDKVIIAKIDATVNDLPEEMPQLPTIKLYPAGDKKNPVLYSGNRSVQDMINFVATNGAHKAEVEEAEEAEESETAPKATEADISIETPESDDSAEATENTSSQKSEQSSSHDEL